TIEVIYGTLHAGGKFDSESYKSSAGLNGVGSSVANAMSEKFIVTSYRDGNATTVKFENGGSKASKPKVVKSKEHGTEVRMYPDPTVLTDVKYNFDTICDHVKNEAYFVKVKFILKDERTGKEVVYEFENGIKQYLDDMSSSTKIFPDLFIEGGTEIPVSIGLAITTDYTEKLESFVNLVHTTQGGTHETGFRSGLTRAFNDYGKQSGILKKQLEGVDIREGLVAVLSINVPEKYLQFESQTKEKLGTPEAKKAVEDVVYEKLKYFLIENPKTAKNALDKMVKASQTREAVRKAKEEMRSAKNKSKIDQLISSKLSPCREKNGKKNELFLVEGDSAGGSAKQGRDSKYQAILPLKGKTLNPEKASMIEVLKNEELNTIIHCVGAGIGDDFDIKKIKYDKVIVMSDADVDGSHIQCLLITFFYRYMRPFIEEGHLYIAKPPLYKLSKGNKVEYAYNDDDLVAKQKKMGKCSLQRYKGLGEMNASQLWETTMNPESRTLRRLTIEDAKEAEKTIITLMGNDVQKRKDWINKNVKFVNEDHYII
ncbi:MAG: toprim domain-containing protein, partial [Firmicutes bacterium]|nr:toprim domain-containing protein [Bacillota bacterium]